MDRRSRIHKRVIISVITVVLITLALLREGIISADALYITLVITFYFTLELTILGLVE